MLLALTRHFSTVGGARGEMFTNVYHLLLCFSLQSVYACCDIIVVVRVMSHYVWHDLAVSGSKIKAWQKTEWPHSKETNKVP